MDGVLPPLDQDGLVTEGLAASAPVETASGGATVHVLFSTAAIEKGAKRSFAVAMMVATVILVIGPPPRLGRGQQDPPASYLAGRESRGA